ncbi:MAG: DUF3298 domain-containing protein [Lewinellaceae bacterium]|nr:DUF3298 domain-containing protein [Lewinellaceae bacterium]
MRKITISIAGLFGLAFVFSCQSKKQEPSTAQPVSLENRVVRQNKGTDCDKQPDSQRTDCAIIDFSIPKIQGADTGNSLDKSINAWADQFLIRLLTWTDYNEPGKGPQTLDAAIQRFHTIHNENAGSVFSGMFKAICTNGTLLNDGRYLTLMLDGYSFLGGNRALEEVAVATFDVETGKQLTFDDLVNDPNALLPMAQAKVRETRAQAFSEGFEFDRTEPFALPSSYGLSPDGFVFHYQPDEIFRLGGATEFTVPYNELGANLKVSPPHAGAAGSADPTGIYKVQGTNLVIPTFEIEVNNSATTGNTLAKKKETVIVSAMFWAVPKDPNEKAKGDDGFISVLNKDIELSGDNRIARFEGLTFNKNLLEKMEDQDVRLLINIFSGRKSSRDNLLDCGILDMKASQFANKRFVLGCKLIGERTRSGAGTSGFPEACYALPESGAAPRQRLPFLVDCSENGNMQFAGRPVKSYEDLVATLRPLLKGMIKQGVKPADLPGIETAGCMMGNSSAIRDYYDEMKAELTGAGKKNSSGKTGNATRPASVPARSATPAVTLKQNGDLFVNGLEVTDLEHLRKVLQETLLKGNAIPDKLNLKTVGQTGMGMRAEVNTVIAESIAGAKWVRKKSALAKLNAAVGKKLGTDTRLEPGSYRTSGNFAYISAKPKQTNGNAIDYRSTTYAGEFAAGKFADNTIGLLRYEKGAWKILIYSIGVSKPPVDIWVKDTKRPGVCLPIRPADQQAAGLAGSGAL